MESTVLDASQIAEEAERAALTLPVEGEGHFQSFLSCVAIDEPVVHLMPFHLVSPELRENVDKQSLYELGVAGKLEYARNRWLDEMVDAPDVRAVLFSAHRFNDALLTLINDRYARVIGGSAAARFFPILADLHARHGLSLILDGTRLDGVAPSATLAEYVEHAKARHGPWRAPVDAVQLLAGASNEQLRRARLSWHNWALGAQFYDDALDLEEDYEGRNRNWIVGRTLECFDRLHTDARADRLPGTDSFYEAALSRGVICEALAHAESFFAEAARLADSVFPSWVVLQRACSARARSLKEDYEKFVVEAGRA